MISTDPRLTCPEGKPDLSRNKKLDKSIVGIFWQKNKAAMICHLHCENALVPFGKVICVVFLAAPNKPVKNESWFHQNIFKKRFSLLILKEE